MRRTVVALVCLFAAVTVSAADWPVNHGDNRRSGWLPSQARFNHFSTAFAKKLDGAVYASPILVGANVVVATENNSVYAFDANTGALRWGKHLRAPVALAKLPCGNINPLGITSTPVYDAATKRIFVVTESPDATSIARHEVFGLDAATGATVLNRRVEVPGTDPAAQQQRAALGNDGKGNILVSFGGLAGDCGNYKGAVISLRANGALGANAYVVPTTREAGIWAAGGPVITADGSVYVSVGNGASVSAYDYSDSVTKLSPSMVRQDFFAPSTWANDNVNDWDLGSLTPAFTANGKILQAGKSGTGYVLDAAHLGGIGGQLFSGPLCMAYGVSAVTYSTVYLPCTDGITRVDVGSDGIFHAGWKQGLTHGSPVAGNGALYALNSSGGILYALNGRTGAVLGHISVGGANRFATPALGPTKIYVGTLSGLVAVKVN